MAIPLYPTVHARVDTEFAEAFTTNTVRLTVTTHVPRELVDDVELREVVTELLGKVKELIKPQKELTDGR